MKESGRSKNINRYIKVDQLGNILPGVCIDTTVRSMHVFMLHNADG